MAVKVPVAVDPQIWKACAGPLIKIPRVGFSAYYFPAGHCEQRDLLVDAVTDEVFARIGIEHLAVKEGEEVDGVVAVQKLVLKPGDLIGGFVMSESAVDSILPAPGFKGLNSSSALMHVKVTDLQGVVWVYPLILAGSPPHHILAADEFIARKRLMAQDEVMLIRRQRGDVFIGIRPHDEEIKKAVHANLLSNQVDWDKNAIVMRFTRNRRVNTWQVKHVPSDGDVFAPLHGRKLDFGDDDRDGFHKLDVGDPSDEDRDFEFPQLEPEEDLEFEMPEWNLLEFEPFQLGPVPAPAAPKWVPPVFRPFQLGPGPVQARPLHGRADRIARLNQVWQQRREERLWRRRLGQ